MTLYTYDTSPTAVVLIVRVHQTNKYRPKSGYEAPVLDSNIGTSVSRHEAAEGLAAYSLPLQHAPVAVFYINSHTATDLGWGGRAIEHSR